MDEKMDKIKKNMGIEVRRKSVYMKRDLQDATLKSPFFLKRGLK